MSIHVDPKRRRRKPAPMTRGGPVTITKADGTTEVQPAYSGPELQKITKRGRRTD